MFCRSLLVLLFLFVGHCVVCSSSIYGFWLSLWYHQPFHFANWIPLICHQRMWDKGNNRNSHLCLNSGPLPPIWRKWSTCSHSVWQTRRLQCCHFRFLTMYFYLFLLGLSIFIAVCSFVSLWWVCLICMICMVLHLVTRDKLWRLIKWGY